MGSVAGRVAGELALQAGGGAAGEATAQAVTGEFKPGDILMEAIAELPTAAIEIPGNYKSTMDQAVRVEKITQVVQELNDLSKANKTRTRDIDTFKEFIDQATEDGPVQNVYVSADVLRQSGMANELAKISPMVAAQIEGALATNGEVQIPITEYMANIAPTDVSAAIIDDLRVEGETMTRREAREFIEAYAVIVKDSIAGSVGEPMILRPWQQRLINGLLVEENGALKHRSALIGMPRKNGKSALLTGLALWQLYCGPAGEIGRAHV